MLHIPVFIVSGVLFLGSLKLYRNINSRKNSSTSNVEKKLSIEKSVVNLKNVLVSKSVKDINNTEKTINQNLNILLMSLGLAIAGTFIFPPLFFASSAIVIYTIIPVWREVYKSLFEEHKLNASVIDAIVSPLFIIFGYYFIAVVGRLLFVLSEKLVFKIKDNSRKKLSNIFGELPKFVWVLKDGIEFETPLKDLKINDIVVVNAGEAIFVDGMITEGMASIDQHILTGESQPLEKGLGDEVFSATIVLSGKIYIQVNRSGKETIAANIWEILNNTAEYKISIQSRGEKVADKMVLPTLAISVWHFLLWELQVRWLFFIAILATTQEL